ncbi:hypothetical protein ACJX0J_033392 [Zea mays]
MHFFVPVYGICLFILESKCNPFSHKCEYHLLKICYMHARLEYMETFGGFWFGKSLDALFYNSEETFNNSSTTGTNTQQFKVYFINLTFNEFYKEQIFNN